MKRLWVCYNCESESWQDESEFVKGTVFEADEPKKKGDVPTCPKCGASGPLARRVIAMLVVKHFEPNHPIRGKGTGEIACEPGKRRGAKIRCTNEPRIVNCPACKKSEPFKKIMGELDDPPEYRVPEVASDAP